MRIEDAEAEEIKKQLPDYVEGTSIEARLYGYVLEIEENLGDVRLKGPDSQTVISEVYFSRRLLEQAGLDEGSNKFFALVEYESNSGMRMDLVKLV